MVSTKSLLHGRKWCLEWRGKNCVSAHLEGSELSYCGHDASGWEPVLFLLDWSDSVNICVVYYDIKTNRITGRETSDCLSTFSRCLQWHGESWKEIIQPKPKPKQWCSRITFWIMSMSNWTGPWVNRNLNDRKLPSSNRRPMGCLAVYNLFLGLIHRA